MYGATALEDKDDMKRLLGKRLSGSVSLAALALTTVAFASATGVEAGPIPQKQLSRGAAPRTRSTPEPKAVHLVFGTLTSVKGAALVLQTRHGVLLRVDASAALAAGTYSAPLFAGKIVAIGGYFDGAHVLRAQSVTRLTKIDPSTTPDR